MKIPTACRRLRGTAVLSGALLLACVASGRAANLNYTVYLNTASLTNNTHAPFSLDVVLGSGAQTPNSDNTVTLSNFMFYNGSVGATTYSSGGETGSMSSTVTLTTSTTDNELAQQFSSTVTEIQFSVSMTNVSDNPFADQFNVAILDSGLNNIPTTDPGGGNTLVLANLSTGQTLSSVQTYGSTANGEAPGVSAAVPEPTPAAALLAGLGLLGVCARFKTPRRRAQA